MRAGVLRADDLDLARSAAPRAVGVSLGCGFGAVVKQAGDRVFAATLLTDGKLFVRTEQTGNVTRAASIVIFDFATRIRVSAPTAVLAAMTAAARRDVLIKGGRALEQLARMDTIVFDKTGTLTAGSPSVTEVRALAPGYSPEGVLRLAASAERRLRHPAAEAIVRTAELRGLEIPEHAEAEYTVGQGRSALVEGTTILVGAVRYLARHDVDVPARVTPSASSVRT